MSWHTRIAQNSENVGGVQSKKVAAASSFGLKRSALGEIGNKVVSRSNSLVANKSSGLANPKELIKPTVKLQPVKSGSINSQKTEFTKPLPRSYVAQRVKRTFSNTSVASVVLPPPKEENSSKEADLVSKNEPDFIDVDKADGDSPLLVAHYAFEIYQYLQTLEDKFPIRENFLEGQQVTPRMRSVLVDWLIEVQLQYHLLQETLYLGVQILDRYLQAVPSVCKKYLQLVGVASMYIASKYEEIYMPDISDFIFITDNAYNKEQLISMEAQIVKALDFEFSRPVSLTFLRRYSKVVEAMPIHHCFSKYFLELALMEYSFSHVKPSLVAAAALYISLCIHDLKGKKGPELWDAKMVHYSSYTLTQVQETAKKLAPVIVKAPDSKFEAVKKKYSASKMMKVSLRCELEGETLKRLAEGLSPFH